jgi:hypothetical protein
MLHRLTFSSKKLGALLLIFCVVSVSLATSSGAAYQERPAAPTETIINSNITTDTTWTLAGSPYHVTDHIAVEQGVTLTIEPGVTVWIGGDLYFGVYDGASIIAKGTPTQHIIIDRYIDPETHLGPRWKKMWFYGNTTSYFRYVDFAYGGAKASGDDTILYFEGPGTHVLNNCTIQASKQQGLVATGASLNVTIAGTLFQGNGRYPIIADNGVNLAVTGSTINAGGNLGLWLRPGSVPATITIADSNLLSSGGFSAVANGMSTVYCINAQNNWWGATNGPYDSSSASDACGLGSHLGGGSWATNGVDYRNWLTAEAPLVGITTSPNAAFTVTPDPTVVQPPGTVYTFDASGSTDTEDYASSLEVCWDWDNNGVCDTAYSTTKTTTHSFTPGVAVQTIRLVVRDTDNLTSEATQDINLNAPPTPAFTFTQPTWAQVDFDASGSTDDQADPSVLQVKWDFEGDGVSDTTYTTVKTATYTYTHQGRYFPTLYVKDTDGVTSTLRKPVDIIPLAATEPITGSGGTLVSVDGTVQVAVYTDTVGGEVISNGLVITHTPWLTLPHSNLEGIFTYQGFNLSARSLLTDSQPINEISGTYTITISYNYDYLAGVLHLPFEDKLELYRWSDAEALWTPVTFTLEATSNWLVATTSFFGDFALSVDARIIYLPMIFKGH